MQRRIFLAVASTSIAATAGCSSIVGDGGSGGESGGDADERDRAVLEDASAGAVGAQTLRIAADESIAGQSLSTVSATYPRDRFLVDGASHDSVAIAVDRDGDGEPEEEFGGDAISGANNNDYSFTITMETGYELADGDVVAVEYPSVENPADPGEYEVTVTLNEERETSVTVTVE